MDTSSPFPTYIAYSVGYLTDLDLIEWAVGYVPSSEHFADDVDLIELASLNTKESRCVARAGPLLKSFVTRLWPAFRLDGAKTERYAKLYLKRKLEQYLAEMCNPNDVCRMVHPIQKVFDFPSWLGSMYDACNGIEPDAAATDHGHFVQAVGETLEAL